MNFSKPTSAVALAAVATLAVAGCGSSSPSSNSASSSGAATGATATLPSKDLLKAADLSAASKGYKIQLSSHVTTSQGTVTLSGTGAFNVSPENGQMTMSVQDPAASLPTMQIGMVLSGATAYIKIPSSLTAQLPGVLSSFLGGKQWIEVDLASLGGLSGVPGIGSIASSSSTLTKPGAYLSYLKAAGNITDLGPQTIDGVSTTHFRAQIDLAKALNAVPASDKSAVQQLLKTAHTPATSKLPMDIWVDGADLVRQISFSLTAAVPSAGTVTSETKMDFLGYGSQPTAAAPAASQTLNLSSLLAHGL